LISPARILAFDVLLRVGKGGYASDLLREGSAELDSRDAALAEAIVLGVLRNQAQLDFLIRHVSGRSEAKLDQEVRIALRMGIYQIRYLERVPRHAAVAESVELVKRARKRSAAGFVNAVLRKLTRDPVPWPDAATALSVPAWMLARWTEQYGSEQAAAIARAALEEPETPVNPATGRRQDFAAQQIVPLLEIEPGMLVLDLCAAPGNKTAQALAGGARVVACDRYLKRLAQVPVQALRVVLDATQPLPFGTKFDRILVDAPCSGTGTLARNPEIKWRLQKQHLARFAEVQETILRNALECLKPGGLLVYSTCSLEREENENIVAGLNVRETRHWLPGSPGGGASSLSGTSPALFPRNHSVPAESKSWDGFFAAVIQLESGLP
jgi:16S rRNA (cytosine967-C5)-methyltransferase